MKGIKTLSIKPEDIQLIVITHGHWDHIGSAKEIKEITGAKSPYTVTKKLGLRIAETRAARCESLGSIFGQDHGYGLCRSFRCLQPMQMLSLEMKSFLWPTMGSQPESFLLLVIPWISQRSARNGGCLRWRLGNERIPLAPWTGAPHLCRRHDEGKEELAVAVDRGARTVYPAHGKPFSADAIQRALL